MREKRQTASIDLLAVRHSLCQPEDLDRLPPAALRDRAEQIEQFPCLEVNTMKFRG